MIDLNEHLVLKTIAGSHLYGTAGPDSDRDFRGVIIPPEEYFTGLKTFEQHTESEPDVVYYDIRKFFNLALKGNPSILEVFQATRVRVMLPFGGTILDLWPQVLSQQLIRNHLGMANAHLARLKAPWRRAGSKGRKAIEEHGYNTKDAAHVLRVLQQCAEILEDKRITFPRPNADWLRMIRNGVVPLEDVIREAETCMERVKDLEALTSLPEYPDAGVVSRNVSMIVHGALYFRRACLKGRVIDRETGVDDWKFKPYSGDASARPI